MRDAFQSNDVRTDETLGCDASQTNLWAGIVCDVCTCPSREQLCDVALLSNRDCLIISIAIVMAQYFRPLIDNKTIGLVYTRLVVIVEMSRSSPTLI